MKTESIQKLRDLSLTINGSTALLARSDRSVGPEAFALKLTTHHLTGCTKPSSETIALTKLELAGMALEILSNLRGNSKAGLDAAHAAGQFWIELQAAELAVREASIANEEVAA